MPAKAQPLVLFGGTFDPVHRGHIAVAESLSRTLYGADVLLLPNAVPPHRPQPVADGAQRMAMLQLACADYPCLTPCDWELQQPGPSYTLNTLRHFRQQCGPDTPIFWVMGADSFSQLHRWHAWQDYPALCHLAVAPRPGSATPTAEVAACFQTGSAAALCQRPSGGRLTLDSPVLDISSSAIRQTLSECGQSDHLQSSVMAHIQQQGLYTMSVR